MVSWFSSHRHFDLVFLFFIYSRIIDWQRCIMSSQSIRINVELWKVLIEVFATEEWKYSVVLIKLRHSGGLTRCREVYSVSCSVVFIKLSTFWWANKVWGSMWLVVVVLILLSLPQIPRLGMSSSGNTSRRWWVWRGSVAVLSNFSCIIFQFSWVFSLWRENISFVLLVSTSLLMCCSHFHNHRWRCILSKGKLGLQWLCGISKSSLWHNSTFRVFPRRTRSATLCCVCSPTWRPAASRRRWRWRRSTPRWLLLLPLLPLTASNDTAASRVSARTLQCRKGSAWTPIIKQRCVTTTPPHPTASHLSLHTHITKSVNQNLQIANCCLKPQWSKCKK